MKAVRTVHPVEGLESRRLLSAGPVLHDGLLRINGDNRVANEIIVQLDAADAAKLTVSFNGTTTSYAVADVSKISIKGGKRNDLIEIRELNGAISIAAVLQGNQGDDTLIGGSGNDVIKGLGGRDSIVGNAGDDRIYGGVGDDNIAAGDGNDYVKADNGNDSVSGGTGDDVLKGMPGRDTISGDEGNDRIDGGSGDDSLLGGAGDDVIWAKVGRDNVSGGDGADTLHLSRRAQHDDDPADILS